MNVNKLLTPYNHNKGSASRIKYIVIHYVGALGGAKANCEFYAGGNRGASAHYYVDFDGSIWQSVEEANIAWHCGASTYKHNECRNANSIGIELCVRNKGSQSAESKDWWFEDATAREGIALTRWLMDKYKIPAGKVIRHFDETGKICPNPYVYNHTRHTWDAFKAAIGQTAQSPPTPAPALQPAPTTPAPSPTSNTYTLRDFIGEVQGATGARVDGIAGPETLSKTVTVSRIKNNRHAVVRAIQKRFNSAGFDCGIADWIAGAMFDASMRALQGANGCVVDGEATAGNLTWRKLLGMS